MNGIIVQCQCHPCHWESLTRINNKSGSQAQYPLDGKSKLSNSVWPNKVRRESNQEESWLQFTKMSKVKIARDSISKFGRLQEYRSRIRRRQIVLIDNIYRIET